MAMSQKRDSFFVGAKSGKLDTKNLKKEKREPPDSDHNKEDTETKIKKPFDKKTYRLKKYSNKYKLEKWEDHRKKKLLRNYYKEVKKDTSVGSYKPFNFDEDNKHKEIESIPGKFVRHPDLISKDETDNSNADSKPVSSKNVKKDAFWRAKEEFHRLKQSKEDKKKEIELKKKEKEEKMLEYYKKKAERFKKLNKKTRKGQPVMTGRLELLFEKIEQSK